MGLKLCGVLLAAASCTRCTTNVAFQLQELEADILNLQPLLPPPAGPKGAQDQAGLPPPTEAEVNQVAKADTVSASSQELSPQAAGEAAAKEAKAAGGKDRDVARAASFAAARAANEAGKSKQEVALEAAKAGKSAIDQLRSEAAKKERQERKQSEQQRALAKMIAKHEQGEVFRQRELVMNLKEQQRKAAAKEAAQQQREMQRDKIQRDEARAAAVHEDRHPKLFTSIQYAPPNMWAGDKLLPPSFFGNGDQNSIVIDVSNDEGFTWPMEAYKEGYLVYSFKPAGRSSQQLKTHLKKMGVVEDCVAEWHREDLKRYRAGSRPSRCYYGFVGLISAAASDRDGMAPLASRPVSQGLHSRAPTVRLDSVLPEKDVFYLHLDVRGGELQVLKGADNLLRSGHVKNLHIKYWPKAMRSAGNSALKLLQYVHSVGMQCYHVGGLWKWDMQDKPSVDQYVKWTDDSQQFDVEGDGFTSQLLCQPKGALPLNSANAPLPQDQQPPPQ